MTSTFVSNVLQCFGLMALFTCRCVGVLVCAWGGGGGGGGVRACICVFGDVVVNTWLVKVLSSPTHVSHDELTFELRFQS